jgi:hypothetical protein
MQLAIIGTYCIDTEIEDITVSSACQDPRSISDYLSNGAGRLVTALLVFLPQSWHPPHSYIAACCYSHLCDRQGVSCYDWRPRLKSRKGSILCIYIIFLQTTRLTYGGARRRYHLHTTVQSKLIMGKNRTSWWHYLSHPDNQNTGTTKNPEDEPE